MYAIVANGISTLCYTQSHLNFIMAVYPYTKFTYCRSEEEGRHWLRQHARSRDSREILNYGDTGKYGYIDATYVIADNSISYTLDTNKVGNVRLSSSDRYLVDNRADNIFVKVTDIVLNDEDISAHVIAVRRILDILGEFVDVNIHVPDMSVYLALTAYTGMNYIIRGTREYMRMRFGAISFTIDEEGKGTQEDVCQDTST